MKLRSSKTGRTYDVYIKDPLDVIKKLNCKYKRVKYEEGYLVRTNKRITTYFRLSLNHKKNFKCPYCSTLEFPKMVITNMDHMEKIRCSTCNTSLRKIKKYINIYKPKPPTNLMSEFDINQMERLLKEKQSLF